MKVQESDEGDYSLGYSIHMCAILPISSPTFDTKRLLHDHSPQEKAHPLSSVKDYASHNEVYMNRSSMFSLWHSTHTSAR